MRTSKQILPGIKAIHYFDGSSLPPRVDLRAICGEKIIINRGSHTELDICDKAECQREREYEKNSYHDKVTLSFASTDVIPQLLNIAFVVEDVNGSCWLIGSKENPFPIVKVTDDLGTANGDTATHNYKISHIALRSLVPCIL